VGRWLPQIERHERSRRGSSRHWFFPRKASTRRVARILRPARSRRTTSGRRVFIARQAARQPAVPDQCTLQKNGQTTQVCGQAGGRSRESASRPAELRFDQRAGMRGRAALGVGLLDLAMATTASSRGQSTALGETYSRHLRTPRWRPHGAAAAQSVGARTPTTLRRDAKHQPSSVKNSPLGLPQRAWQYNRMARRVRRAPVRRALALVLVRGRAA